jgi:hypothetical protein
MPRLFHSNQNTYFPQGMLLGGSDFLQHDWFASTRPAHIAFTYLIALLSRLGILVIGTNILAIILIFALGLAAWILVREVYRSLSGRLTTSVCFDRTIIFITCYFLALNMQTGDTSYLFMHTLTSIPNWDPLNTFFTNFWVSDGLAGQRIFSAYFQPSEFGILLLLAVGMLLLHRKWLAVALLVIASTFHFSYTIHSGALVVFVAAHLIYQQQRSEAIKIVLVFMIGMLPAIIYATSFIGDPQSATSAAILVHMRQPHHAIPSHWWDAKDVHDTVIMAIASLIAIWKLPGVLRWIMPLGFAYTCLGVLIGALVSNDMLALLYPWRGSTYLYPLSVFIVSTTFINYAAKLLERLSPYTLKAAQVLVALLATNILLLEALALTQRDFSDTPSTGSTLIQAHTQPSDIIMVPVNWQNSRLDASRSIFVDRKSHPYQPTEVIEWWRRIEIAERFVETPDERTEICRTEGFNYYILLSDEDIDRDSLVAAENDTFLLRCPNPGTTQPPVRGKQ